MSNAKPFTKGGHPVHQFGDFLSFNDPASQGWTTDSELTHLAAKCQDVSTKAVQTVDARKKIKEARTTKRKAAFDEQKRRWRRENGLKADPGPPPKKSEADIEFAKMWMREEATRQYRERKTRRAVKQELKEIGKLTRRGHEAMKNFNEEE